MSYARVVPRDLFNEANLLKCYGQIFIQLENVRVEGVSIEYDGSAFNIVQDQSSGCLFIENVVLFINGEPQSLFRPLNSRAAYPLYLTDENDDEIKVFDEEGRFTPDMLRKLGCAQYENAPEE